MAKSTRAKYNEQQIRTIEKEAIFLYELQQAYKANNIYDPLTQNINTYTTFGKNRIDKLVWENSDAPDYYNRAERIGLELISFHAESILGAKLEHRAYAIDYDAKQVNGRNNGVAVSTRLTYEDEAEHLQAIRRKIKNDEHWKKISRYAKNNNCQHVILAFDIGLKELYPTSFPSDEIKKEYNTLQLNLFHHIYKWLAQQPKLRSVIIYTDNQTIEYDRASLRMKPLSRMLNMNRLWGYRSTKEANEHCWTTGDFSYECRCSECLHLYNCPYFASTLNIPKKGD